MTKDEALRKAIDSLVKFAKGESGGLPVTVLIEALQKALAQPEREWLSLTTEEMKEIADRYHLKPPNVPVAFRAIEAKLKEKNCGS